MEFLYLSLSAHNITSLSSQLLYCLGWIFKTCLFNLGYVNYSKKIVLKQNDYKYFQGIG